MGNKTEEWMDDELCVDEIERYVRKLKNGKAPGMDGVVSDLYKERGRGVTEGMYELLKHIY